MTRWVAAFAILAACGGRALSPVPEPALPASVEAGVRAAVGEAVQAARKQPDDAAAVARLGMVLHAHGELGAAAQAYERAAGLAPERSEYAYLLGLVWMAEGKYEQAAGTLRQAVAQRETAVGRMRLGDALYGGGRVAEARKEYARAVALDGSLAGAYYGLGRSEEGAAAERALRRAVEIYPRYGAARFALAGLYRKAGRKDEAEPLLADYERDKLESPPLADEVLAAVEAMDVSAAGMMRTAQRWEKAGRVVEAAELVERAVQAAPGRVQGWVTLIALRARRGQPREAEEAYRRAVALEPGHAEAHYNYGVFLAGNERMEEARAAFARAVAADARHAEALDGLGAVLEWGGAWEKAAGYYRRAVAAKPGLRLAQFHLGRNLANQRRYGEAMAALARAAEPLDEAGVEALYALGATEARAGLREKAAVTLRRVLQAAQKYGMGEMTAAIERDLGRLGR